MEMVGAHWVTMAGTVCASWAGGALAVTPPWKLPAVMSRTTTEVKSQTTPADACRRWPGVDSNYHHSHVQTIEFAAVVLAETGRACFVIFQVGAVPLERRESVIASGQSPGQQGFIKEHSSRPEAASMSPGVSPPTMPSN